jgi:hypothetical protein
VRHYPVLKRAPPEERIGLFQEARRYAFGQWTAYATLGLVAAAATYILREQIFGGVAAGRFTLKCTAAKLGS